MNSIYLPLDSFSQNAIDADLAADYLEFSAICSEEMIVPVSRISSVMDIGEDNEDISLWEEVVCQASVCIQKRSNVLGESYPFSLDEEGSFVKFHKDKVIENQITKLAASAYLLSLVLSNLQACTPLIKSSKIYPSKEEEKNLRGMFQYVATAAMAVELNGRAWSFGFPRPDGSGFQSKLTEVWMVIKDGFLNRAEGAPSSPKDDQVDIIAAKPHADGLPGFLFALAQVATGANWSDKSLRGHLDHVFFARWFSSGQPDTQRLCYHVIPFTLTENKFKDSSRLLGSILHRLRIPRLILDFISLKNAEEKIDVYEQLLELETWAQLFIQRCQVRYN